jgi:glycosyltransferase involved in cell wall biosynthesis
MGRPGLAAIVGAMAEDRAAASGNRPTFSVVIATVGRRTLAAALASVSRQLEPGDEIIVVCNDRGDQGDWARNSAIERAIASHLVFLDDDDEFVPDALAKFRRFALENPGLVGLFRMQLPTGDLVWNEPVFAYGQVGGPTMVVPNVRGRLGSWVQSEVGNDWTFLEASLQLQGTQPIFRDEIVARVRPGGTFEGRWDELRYRLRVGARMRRLVSNGR